MLVGSQYGTTVGSQPKGGGVPMYKSIGQIKPGGSGYVKGREYYEDMKGSVEEIKNKKGKTVDIPE